MSYDAVFESAKPLKGAIEGTTGGSVHMALIPGYGLVFTCFDYGEINIGATADQLKSVLYGLAGMVNGLPDSDVVCIAYRVEGYDNSHRIVVVEMHPRDPATLRVFQDDPS